jgi:FRG domain
MNAFPATVLLNISHDFDNHRLHRENSWYGYLENDGWGATPFSVSTLFRGQNARYLPMLPAISRGLQSPNTGQLWKSTPADQAKIILRLAQSWWFCRELQYHPLASHAKEQKLELDGIALAQHYGIPTGFLDLTDDFNVGAFFATCFQTEHGWEPMESGVGIIYRVNLEGLETPVDRYKPLGPQQLPRPTEQCAWVTELPLCHAFDGWPNVQLMQFHHDKYVGEYFLDMFSGGEKLFPPDPLALVANEILTSGEIPTVLIEQAMESFAEDTHGLRAEHFVAVRHEISQLASFIDYRRILTDQHVSNLLGDSEWRKKMLTEVKVKWRAVRRVPITSDR